MRSFQPQCQRYTCANDLSTRDWQKLPELSGSRGLIFFHFYFFGNSLFGVVLKERTPGRPPRTLGVPYPISTNPFGLLCWRERRGASARGKW